MQTTKAFSTLNSNRPGFQVLALKLVLVFLAILVMFLIAFQVILPPDLKDTFAEARIKHDHLARLPSPKIVITAGSNALYSIDSAMMEEQLGVPVNNSSMQAGLPLQYVLADIEPYIHSGDLVLLPIEYQYFDERNGSPQSIARLMEVYPRVILNLPVKYLLTLPDLVKIIFQTKYMRWKSHSYSTAPLDTIFDEQGDIIAHLDLPPVAISNKVVLGSFTSLGEEPIRLLNAFTERVTKKGARVLFFYPSTRMTNCLATNALSGAPLDAVGPYLHQHLQMTIVGTPWDYCFPDEDFFNTEYHMTRHGRMVRTQKMIDDLRSIPGMEAYLSR
jgi:hypothetical protein